MPDVAAVLAFDALALDGELAATLDTDLPVDTLVTEAPEDCARDTEDTLAVLPVRLAAAMPPLVETRLVNTLSEPVLCLEPCQLSSFI